MAFTLLNEDMNFMPTGVLSSAYPKETDAVDNSNTLLITNPIDMDVIQDTLTYQLEKNIAVIGTGNSMGFWLTQDMEFIAFKTIVSTGDNYRINGVTRGAFHTPPIDHAASDRIWFLTYGGGLINRAFEHDSTQNLKLTPHTARGILGTSDAQTLVYKLPSVAMQRAPYPPAKIRTQDGAGTPEEWSTGPVNASNTLSMHWVHRNRLCQTQILNQDDASVSQGTEVSTTVDNSSSYGYLMAIYGTTDNLLGFEFLERTTTSWDYTVAKALQFSALADTEVSFELQALRFDNLNPGSGVASNYNSYKQIRAGVERTGWGLRWGQNWGGVPNT